MIEFKDPADAARFAAGPTVTIPVGEGWMDVDEQERLNPGIQWDREIITDLQGKRWGRLAGTVVHGSFAVVEVDIEDGIITIAERK